MPKIAMVCGYCSETFHRYPSQAGPYCGRACGWAHQKANAHGPSVKPCRQCGEPITEDYPSSLPERVYCSKRCWGDSRRVRVALSCEVCGVQMLVVPAVVGRKKCCSRRCNGVRSKRVSLRKWPGRRSRQANEAIAAWLDMGRPEPYVEEMQIDQFSVDLAFPLRNLAVELDGAYWHARPEVAARDLRKDAHLERLGWRVARIVMGPNEKPAAVAGRINALLEAKAVA